ncbi:MAG: YibE/F family protein [Candidatus Pacebacteria bacterium]|nr:YibE/F family protein [Candidatus Paceibacterota bacterium]
MQWLQKSLFLIAITCGMFTVGASTVHAQELLPEVEHIWKAQVLSVSAATTSYEAFGVESVSQMVEARIREGVREGEVVRFRNDFILLDAGEKFYLRHSVQPGGEDSFAVFDRDRQLVLGLLALLFVAAVVGLGGIQGVRALLSLSASFLLIMYVLVPSLLAAYPPVLMSVVIASGILALAIFITHGINRGSLIAYVGTVTAVLCTGLLASAVSYVAGFTGLGADEATYLNLATKGTLDLSGLLLAGIIIGMLGVLDDIAITQVAVVRELYHADSHLSARSVFTRAMRVGKEHAGALVNTLVLAYSGAALPLIMLFALSQESMLFFMNREIFAVEIVRALVGSIGLMVAVPVTTGLAAWLLRGHAASAPLGHAHHH